MRVLVAVAQVASLVDDYEVVDGTVPASSLEYGLNEWDEFAVEEALRVAEASDDPDAEVVAVTVGPERAESAARTALAMGVDRAVRLWDSTLAERAAATLSGAPVLDVGARARLLASVVDDEEPTLVVTGARASDDGYGSTGVALAATVDYQWAAVVSELGVDAESGVATVHRGLEGNVEEVTELDLPAVVTVRTGINEPRPAGDERDEGAVVRRGLDDLGLAPSAADCDLAVTALSEPDPPHGVGDDGPTIFEGTPGEASGRLAEVLVDLGVTGADGEGDA
jgi:electron transfer flavoprotein beta subunit